MDVINNSDIQLKQFVSYGSFASVFEVEYNDKKYAYKNYGEIPEDVLNNILYLLDESVDSEFLVPKYLIESKSRLFYKGYLMDYNAGLKELDEICGLEKRITCLRNARNIIEKLHKKYKIIHGDLHGSNMLFDEETAKAYLCDFDTSCKKGEEKKLKEEYFSCYVLNYLKYWPFDFVIDTYMFNLATLSLLTGLEELVVLKKIGANELKLINKNENVKKLSKELLLMDTKNKFSGEYIIDYF